MNRREEYARFWNNYIDYCVNKGSSLFTIDDKISLTIGFEDSLEGLQVVEAIEIVKKQIENSTNIISYGS